MFTQAVSSIEWHFSDTCERDLIKFVCSTCSMNKTSVLIPYFTDTALVASHRTVINRKSLVLRGSKVSCRSAIFQEAGLRAFEAPNDARVSLRGLEGDEEENCEFSSQVRPN